jgi:hypothetical protein
MCATLRIVESHRDAMRTGHPTERADGRAPARGIPVRAGKPWSVDSGESALHHVNVRSLLARSTCSARAREIMDPENTNRVTDDRLTRCSGQDESACTRAACCIDS